MCIITGHANFTIAAEGIISLSHTQEQFLYFKHDLLNSNYQHIQTAFTYLE